MSTEKWRRENQAKLKLYRRNWYYRNKEREISRVIDRKKVLREWLRNFKVDKSCQICSESHPACLTFHHRDPKFKEADISKLVHDGFGIEKIKREIEKCDILCENCHRKYHFIGV